jgi:hypothetical protein
MKPRIRFLILSFCLACSATRPLAMLADAQGVQAGRKSVRLSNPSFPSSVRASLKSGGITVSGYDGNEVVVEARLRSQKPAAEGQTLSKSEPSKSSELPNLTVEEQNNVVTIATGPSDRPIDLTIQVPFKTSLTLGCITNGGIFVKNVEGEIEASNQDGPVTLTNVVGVAIADARNGALLVKLNKVAPNKPMSFSAVNGDIDVTLPSDIKATIDLATQNGRTESDFEIGLTRGKPAQEQGGSSVVLNIGGKSLTLFHIAAKINGGGAEILFKTVNGNVFLRKGAQQ